MIFDQSEYGIRFEWGLRGVEALTPVSDAVIIVDVMSFSTAVTVAAARGAVVFPYRWKDDSRVAFAESVGAALAGPRGKAQYSLSPLSLTALKTGDRIVLPSPNGSTLSLATGTAPTFAGCLRNARAVAKAAMACGEKVSVIACGERWKDDESLRPALEDMVGAGAIITHLEGTRSPEAEAAVAVFEACRHSLHAALERCSSGKQLIAAGFGSDITAIAELNHDNVAPVLRDGAYVVQDEPR